jgi:hypothetical protein
MKRSKSVELYLMTAISGSLLACSPNQNTQQCVDQNGVVVDQSECDRGSPHFKPMYRWYYGGGLFNRGTRVSGGGYSPIVGHDYSPGSSFHSSPSVVSRGGFGSTGLGTGGG